MARLFITVGIPGTGKSTWASTYLKDAKVVSSDAIREELSGDATDQTKNGQVFNVFHQRIGEGLAQDLDVVADSTALDRFARENILAVAAIFKCEIHLIVFSNVEQAAVRNAARERVVPQDVMIKMLGKFEKFKSDLPAESRLYTSVTEIRSLS